MSKLDWSVLWSAKNTCMLCHDVGNTPKERRTHEKLQKHVKKESIYEFLSANAVTTCKDPSLLVKRLTRSNQCLFGVDSLMEIHFEWASGAFWACSICYDSGCTMDSAEQHILSLTHIRRHLIEVENVDLPPLEGNEDRTHVYEEMIKYRDECVVKYKDKACVYVPEVVSCALTREQIMTKLVIKEPASFSVVRIGTKESTTDLTTKCLIQCLACNELIPSIRKHQQRAWQIHEANSVRHKKAVALKAILGQFDTCNVVDEDEDEEENSDDTVTSDCNWKEKENRVVGPVCGIKYLLSCGGDNICELCLCRVSSIEDHFSSESHITRFVLKTNPEQRVTLWRALQQTVPFRLSITMIALSKTKLLNENNKELVGNRLPTLVDQYLFDFNPNVPDAKPEILKLSETYSCMTCKDCNQQVRISAGSTDDGETDWNTHVASPTHLEFLARKSLFAFDEDGYVPMLSTLPQGKVNIEGGWHDITMDSNTYRVQSLCDVGLEYMVEDQENDIMVCLLCARSYKRDKMNAVSNHVRSYMHLNQYINMECPSLLEVLSQQSNETAVQDLLLDWMKRTFLTESKFEQLEDETMQIEWSCEKNWNQIKVFNPSRALEMRQLGQVPLRNLFLAYTPSEGREVIETILPMVDKISKDAEEKTSIDLCTAIRRTPCRIIRIGEEKAVQTKPGIVIKMPKKNEEHKKPIEGNPRILIRCMTCRAAFTTKLDEMTDVVFSVHLKSEEHERRQCAYQSRPLDFAGFSSLTSSYTVKQYDQRDPNKRVTWQYNQATKLQDFVLSVVGLDDIVERRSDEREPFPPYFFCRLCAIDIPRRALKLDEHVRSTMHVMQYLQRHLAMSLFELDAIDTSSDGGKALRRRISELLVNVKPPQDYCIPVYDPFGEKERRTQQAQINAKKEERLRIVAENRQKAFEERIKKEEERRKQRESELSMEKQRREEREAREAEVKERLKKLEEEKARLRQIAIEKARQKEADEELAKRTKLEEEEKRKERAQQVMRADLHSQISRLKALKDRDRAQKLIEEKMQLQRKMTELMERKAQSEIRKLPPSQNTVVVVPDPQLVIPPQLAGRERLGQQSSFAGATSVSSSVYSTSSPMMGVPPPSTYGSYAMQHASSVLDSIGRKPSFSTFVPVAEAMPVYPAKESREENNPTHYRNVAYVKHRSSLIGRQEDTKLQFINTKAELIEYMRGGGAENIPTDELPAKFSQEALADPIRCGLHCLYEVICIDCSDLDSFYCSICGEWLSPSQMLVHLGTAEHRQAYVYREYPMFHRQIVSETNAIVRKSMQETFSREIRRLEQPPKQVLHRLRIVLDRRTIERVWQDYRQFFSLSNDPDVPQAIPAPVKHAAMAGIEDDNDKRKNKEEKEPKKKKDKETSRKRSASRERDKRKRRRSSSRGRRSRSRSRTKRSRSRSRERRGNGRRGGRTRSRSRSPHKKKAEFSWEESAAAFLEKCGDKSAAEKLRSQLNKCTDKGRSSSTTSNEVSDADFQAKMAQLHKFTSSSLPDTVPKTSAVTSSLSAEPTPMGTSNPRPATIPSSTTGTENASTADEDMTAVDETKALRKLLGVMATLEAERTRTGCIDPELMTRLLREVGLEAMDGVSTDQIFEMISEHLTTLGLINAPSTAAPVVAVSEAPPPPPSRRIDLKSYGIDPSHTTTGIVQAPPPVVRATTASSQIPTSLVQSSSNNYSGMVAAARNGRPSSPVVRTAPFTFMRREDLGMEEVSYVYPDADEEEEELRAKELRAEKAREAALQAERAREAALQAERAREAALQLAQREAKAEKEKLAAQRKLRNNMTNEPVVREVPLSQASTGERPLTKMERKKRMLEEAERLRKAAEAEMDDEEDEDWDSVETELHTILQKKPPQPAPITPAVVISPLHPTKPKHGIPSNWKPPKLVEPQRETDTKADIQVSSAVLERKSVEEAVPLCPGQKMPLARTMLPNGKLPPGAPTMHLSAPLPPKPQKAEKKMSSESSMSFSSASSWMQTTATPIMASPVMTASASSYISTGQPQTMYTYSQQQPVMQQMYASAAQPPPPGFSPVYAQQPQQQGVYGQAPQQQMYPYYGQQQPQQYAAPPQQQQYYPGYNGY